MKLSLSAISPLFPYGFYVQWSLAGVTTPGAYKFDLYRSGGMTGPWDLVAGGLENQYAFRDDFTSPVPMTTADVVRPNQLNQFRDYAYRVVATSPSGEVTEVIDNSSPLYEGSLFDRKMMQQQRKAIRDFRLSCKFNGTKAVVLKRRHWGTRCICVDKPTKETIRSACIKCWGTGVIDGYWAPILTFARRLPSANASAITPENKSDANDVQFRLPDVPALEQDDVIVFLKDNSRWRIDTVTSTQIRLQDTHQVVSGQAFDKGHVIFRYAVRTDQIKALF